MSISITPAERSSSVSANDIVQKTIESGASPLTLSYETVRFFERSKVILRSVLEINSLELGRLFPKQYKVVAGRSKQGNELFARQLEKVFEAYAPVSQRVKNLDCITLPVLSRTLLEGAAAEILFHEFRTNAVVPPASLCVEISSDVLFEDIESVKARFSELRDLGIKIALTELGDEFCPIFRLRELSFDIAFADTYSLDLLRRDDESARGLPEYVHLLGAKVFAPEIKEEEKQSAKNAAYDGYSLAGATTSFDEEVSDDEER